jgi:hypothetical protein
MIGSASDEADDDDFEPIDVGQLRQIMLLLGWKWAGKSPSDADIRRVCDQLLSELARDRNLLSAECGGLRAWRDEMDVVHVTFELDIDV